MCYSIDRSSPVIDSETDYDYNLGHSIIRVSSFLSEHTFLYIKASGGACACTVKSFCDIRQIFVGKVRLL